MSMNINASPRSILLGANDLSGRERVYVPEAIPQFLPHVMTFAKRGPLMPQIGVGDVLTSLFGDETFNLRGKYKTHQTLLAKTLSENANQMVFHRLCASDARIARLRFSLDVLDTTGLKYARNSDGSLVLDGSGKPTYVADTEVKVKSLAWVVTAVPNDVGGNTTFGAGANTTGLRSDGAVSSTLKPIFDLECPDPGEWGNGAGVRFSAPNINSEIPFDTRLVQEQKTTMYRMQVVERATAISTPLVQETRYSEQFIDFSLKPDAVNERTDQDLYLPFIYKKNYIDQEATPAMFGTFGRIHVYEANIASILADLYAHEHGALDGADYDGVLGNGTGPTSDSVGLDASEVDTIIPLDAPYAINFFTAVAWNGYQYEGIRMADSIALSTINGSEMRSTVTHYALGGLDGTISWAKLNELVAEQCENYGEYILKADPGYTGESASDRLLDFLNTARWPQSCIIDTGFDLPTKKKIAIPMGRRKDMWVGLCTQELGPDSVINTAATEYSVAVQLQTALRMYPESEYYGTKCCRGIVVGQCGELLNSTWRGSAPMILDLVAKISAYTGASNGEWKEGKNYDINPRNIVEMFNAKTVNCTYKKQSARNDDWAAGLVWVQDYDRSSLFYPAVQTVYDDDTSILNSLLNVLALVEAEKVCDRAWRDLAGISSLTPGQFVKRSDEIITKKLKKRFDGKIIFIPETKITEIDEHNGFSWTTVLKMYGANMKSTGTYTIETRRIEDYVA